MIIEKTLGKIDDYDSANLEIETVILDRELLEKPHQKITSEAGNVYAVSLPEGEYLERGSVIFKDNQKIVVIELADEDILEIRPKGNIEWARAAFNVGNMHKPAYIHEDRIIISYDNIMENLLSNMGIEFSRKTGKLDGIKAGFNNGHRHSHSHSHDHTHSHSHAHTHSHD